MHVPMPTLCLRQGLRALSVLTSLVTAAAYAQSPIDVPSAAHALYAQWYLPQATQAVSSAQALQDSLRSYCAANAATAAPALRVAKYRFQQATNDWETLSAVAMGPMVERRSDRVVDFQPLRVARLEEAIRKSPRTVSDMESIGSPAKGFPAIEHLLWTDVARSGTPACQYAELTSAAVLQEVQAVQHDIQTIVSKAQIDYRSTEEFLNQWLGGLEKLRWEQMEKPLRSASASKKLQLTRMASEGTLESWRAQWSGLRTLAIGTAEKPQDISIATLVAAYGRPRLAASFTQAVKDTDAAIQALQSTDLHSVQAVTTSMARVKRFVEADIASVLDIRIGFSDSDGD